MQHKQPYIGLVMAGLLLMLSGCGHSDSQQAAKNDRAVQGPALLTKVSSDSSSSASGSSKTDSANIKDSKAKTAAEKAVSESKSESVDSSSMPEDGTSGTNQYLDSSNQLVELQIKDMYHPTATELGEARKVLSDAGVTTKFSDKQLIQMLIYGNQHNQTLVDTSNVDKSNWDDISTTKPITKKAAIKATSSDKSTSSAKSSGSSTHASSAKKTTTKGSDHHR